MVDRRNLGFPMTVLLPLLVLAMTLASGCSKATPVQNAAKTPTALVTTSISISITPTTTTTTAASTTATTAPPTTAAQTTPAPTSAATSTTPPTTAAPIPSAGTVYRLAEVRDYVFDGTRTPAMPSPVRITDSYASFLAQLASDVLATSHSSEILDYSVLTTFAGPNGPGVTARDPLTTATRYSWTVPATLTAGATVTLAASGSQSVTTSGGISVYTAGELYFALYGGEASTFEMDFRGDGTGLSSIEPAFGSALPVLSSGQTISNGTYPLNIPAGPSRTLAIEVMFTPFDGNRTLHRIYFYQP